MAKPLSPQTLTIEQRRAVASWAADCAERVLHLFELEAPADAVPREAIARTRAFAAGDSTAAAEIAIRTVAGRAAHSATSPVGAAAARAAAQAAAVAHMGAHALGAPAYAIKALDHAGLDTAAEIDWQVAALTAETARILAQLPLLESDTSGPLGTGLLTKGVLGETIRTLQSRIVSISAA